MLRKMLQEPRNQRLGPIEQSRRLTLQKLGKLQQVALVGLAGKRAQPLLDAQVDEILLNQSRIAQPGIPQLSFARGGHIPIIEDTENGAQYPTRFTPRRERRMAPAQDSR